MNKKIIAILITIMGISILGIVIIQLVWMKNAIQVKNELFDRSVSEALTTTTNRLETMQDFRLINHFSFNNDTIHFRGNLFPPPPPPPPPPPTKHKNGKPTGDRSESSMPKVQLIVNADKNQNQLSYQVITRHNAKVKGENRADVVITTDSLARKIGTGYSKGIKRIDSLVAVVSPDLDSLHSFKQRITYKTRKLRNIADKVVQEITTWEEDVPIERVVETLTKELANRNIPIPFELGIHKDFGFAEKTSDADTVLLASSRYRVNLFPNDIFQKNIKLMVYFPKKESFIYQTLNWLLLISLVFSIIVLVTFATSIYFILKQKKISEMKSDFINNMTHEFKTPIATISVAADSISNQKIIENPERIRYFIDMIKKENIRMNRQVEDILTIARLDKKEFEFKWESFDLHEVIEDAIQSIVLQVEKKGGTIRSSLLAPNPVATSDVAHFANLIYNLLDNANKYSLNAPEINISTSNTAKGVVIVIEDKGIGMSKAVQSRIFERFYRQTSGNIHNVKGFGLGLSYVKAVLEANRGSIHVQSEPGKGSRFEVFIPFILD
jgi:two-component system phosphate regulon sensor histidine kinase PhoR